ncbi:MAG: diguanylate cyclase [Clostridia bacterium]|nr:diguanylate cyclase [Clostridia bacterium]
MEALCGKIKDNIASLNKKVDAPYDLSVSIGIARADHGKELKALIEEADEELYEDSWRRLLLSRRTIKCHKDK